MHIDGQNGGIFMISKNWGSGGWIKRGTQSFSSFSFPNTEKSNTKEEGKNPI